MTSIGAILSLDGAPLESQELTDLASAVGSPHQTFTRSWIDDAAGVGLAACGDAPAPSQPAAVRQLRVAADVRLDNRDELLEQLRDLGPDADDVDLIAAAYDKWGEACPRYLRGDFSFIIWDGRSRTLLAARDVLGVRPLIYSKRDGRLIVASTVGAIARTLRQRPDINRPLIGDFLANRFDRWTSETAFDGICRLPPAHCLVVRNAVVRLTRYHTLGADGGESYLRDDDYVQRFRELFARSVAARIDRVGTAGITLSGGLDSSAIAAQVVELIRGGAIGTTVHSYSSTYPSDPQNDEEPFARSVVAMYPELRASFQSQEGQWAFQEFRDGRDYPLDEPELVINRTVMMWRLLQARRDGCEVVLTGGFADQLLTGWYVPSMMADLGWRALRRELPRFAQGRSALVTVLGGYARRIAWRLPPFRERRRRRLSAELPAPELPNEASFSAYANLTHGGASVSLAQMVHAARMAGVGFAFPYLDRDLVEFCLHLPIHLRFQGGIRKFIVRQAFAGRLPPGVLERQWGTSLWPASRTGVARERALIESMLTGTRLVSLGFLSAREVSGLLPAFDATPEPRAFQRLYRAISVETWLRRITAWPW